MGVKDFFKLALGTPLSIKDLANTKIAVDAMTEIYRTAFGGNVVLTDSKGNITSHINALLQTVTQMQKKNIKLIFVFDSPVPNPLKADTLAKRKASRELNKSHTVNKSMIDNTKKLLTLLGVDYIIANDGADAEQVCAKLSSDLVVDYIISSDADVFLYGGNNVLKSEKRKLVLYTIDEITTALGINKADIVKAGVLLGTDYCEKTPMVGVKTVSKKLNTKLTERQLEAYGVFTSTTDYFIIDNSKNRNLQDLLKWLIELEFSVDRVTKILGL